MKLEEQRNSLKKHTDSCVEYFKDCKWMSPQTFHLLTIKLRNFLFRVILFLVHSIFEDLELRGINRKRLNQLIQKFDTTKT